MGKYIHVGSDRDEREYWLRIMHGALLRKYVAPDDNLFLGHVINAIERGVDISRPEVANTFIVLRRHFGKRASWGSFEYSLNGTNIPASLLAFGTMLHGDVDRWRRTKNAAPFGDFALFEWVLEIRNFAILVRDHWRLAERDELVKVELP
jgi:hypothetical protein